MKQIMVRYSHNKPLAVQLDEITREYNKGTWTGLLFHLYSAFPREKELVLLCKEIRKTVFLSIRFLSLPGVKWDRSYGSRRYRPGLLSVLRMLPIFQKNILFR